MKNRNYEKYILFYISFWLYVLCKKVWTKFYWRGNSNFVLREDANEEVTEVVVVIVEEEEEDDDEDEK